MPKERNKGYPGRKHCHVTFPCQRGPAPALASAIVMAQVENRNVLLGDIWMLAIQKTIRRRESARDQVISLGPKKVEREVNSYQNSVLGNGSVLRGPYRERQSAAC